MTPSTKTNNNNSEEPIHAVAIDVPPGSKTSATKTNWEVAAGNAVDDDQSLGEKQGRSCCGCLCDMRRAVIILSLLGIFNVVITPIINYFLLFEEFEWDEEDGLSQEDEDDLKNLFRLQVGLNVGSLVCYALAIRGAVSYKPRLLVPNMMFVVTSTVYLTIAFSKASDDIESFEYSSTSGIIGGAFGVAMTLYSNITLMKEIRCGIMTPKTYAREKQSCCCV